MDENETFEDVIETDVPDDWDDVDISDIDTDEDTADEVADDEETEDTAEADQPKAEKPGEETKKPDAETKAEPEAKEPDLTFTLKHLDEVKTVGRDEVIALAQKGMDYARIREKLDAATAETTRLKELEAWVKDLAGNQPIEDFIDGIEANKLMEKTPGLDAATALEKVRIVRERKALEAERAKADVERKNAADKEAATAKQKADIDAFVAKFPDVAAKLKTDAKAIPQEVWDRVNAGESLVNAYDAYSAKQEAAAAKAEADRLKAELEAAKQNKKNKERTTGSQSTKGNPSPKDKWMDGWDD